jgi:hypothetical protein
MLPPPVPTASDGVETQLAGMKFLMSSLLQQLQQLHGVASSNQMVVAHLQHTLLATNQRLNEMQTLLFHSREEVRWLTMAMVPTPIVVAPPSSPVSESNISSAIPVTSQPAIPIEESNTQFSTILNTTPETTVSGGPAFVASSFPPLPSRGGGGSNSNSAC